MRQCVHESGRERESECVIVRKSVCVCVCVHVFAYMHYNAVCVCVCVCVCVRACVDVVVVVVVVPTDLSHGNKEGKQTLIFSAQIANGKRAVCRSIRCTTVDSQDRLSKLGIQGSYWDIK